MTQTSASVAAVEEQPELKPESAPVQVDYSETHHMQAELQEVRDMGLAFQARFSRLSEKYYRHEIDDPTISLTTPLMRKHINPFGKYHFDLSRMRHGEESTAAATA